MLHIYYGMGKGKTSTLNGSVVRAKGAGFNVMMVRFLKGRETSEDKLIKQLGINLYSAHPSPKFVLEMNVEEKFKAREAALSSMNFIKSNLHKYDLIALDEFIDLIDPTVNFITESQALDFLNLISKSKEVLVSGHGKYESILKQANLVTYYDPQKHYFDEGIKARKGIEF